QMAGVIPANEDDAGPLPYQGIRQSEATAHMACADDPAGVGADQHLHGAMSPCCRSTSYNRSARIQSSGVSISCTRQRGRMSGTASGPNSGASLLNPAAVPQ